MPPESLEFFETVKRHFPEFPFSACFCTPLRVQYEYEARNQGRVHQVPLERGRVDLAVEGVSGHGFTVEHVGTYGIARSGAGVREVAWD